MFRIIIAVAITILFVSCDHGDHHLKDNVFSVTTPWRSEINLSKEYVAQIHAIQHIEIRAIERGFLQQIHVDEGQVVEEGTALFQLFPRVIEAEFKRSKAEFDVVNLEYKNTRRLARKNVVSSNELALAKAKLDKAQAELELASAHLDFTTIKAPYKGILDRFHVRIGSLIEEGELLTTLSDNSTMWVYFNVTESDYLDYMKNIKDNKTQIVQLRLANGQMYPYKGKIDTVEADFDHETGNIAFRASFENPDGLLRHGETGNVILSEPVSNALLIPQKATFEVLDKKFVYVVDDKNIVKTKQIEISHDLPHLFALKSGLDEGERIIIERLGKVEVGKKIEINVKDSKEVYASFNLPLN